MGSTAQESRELAMQMLFQGDLGKQKPDDVERLFWESRDDVDEETRGFADDLQRAAFTTHEDEDPRRSIEAHLRRTGAWSACPLSIAAC